MIVIFYSINKLRHVDFSHVKPNFHSWDKSHLVIVDNLLYIQFVSILLVIFTPISVKIL